MKIIDLFKKAFKSGASPKSPTQARRFRPSLESLDDRIVPSSLFTWNSTGSTDGTIAANWLENGNATTHTPTGGDSIYVPADKPSLSLNSFGSTPLASLEIQKNYAGTVTFNGPAAQDNVTYITTLIAPSGTLTTGYTSDWIVVKGTGFLGSRDGDTGNIDGTCTLYNTKLRFDSAGAASTGTIESLSCAASYVYVGSGSFTSYSPTVYLHNMSFTGTLGKLEVAVGTAYVAHYDAIHTADAYYGYYADTVDGRQWYNPIQIDINGTLKIANGDYAIGSYVNSLGGTIDVDGTSQLSIVGRPNTLTGAASLTDTGGTINLHGGGPGGIYCNYDAALKGSTVNVLRDYVNYQDGVADAHLVAPQITFTDTNGGTGTGTYSHLNFETNDAQLNLNCGTSNLSLNYVVVSIYIDYMLNDANTIVCGAASFPSSGGSSELDVHLAPGDVSVGSWKIIDTGSTHSSSFGAIVYDGGGLSTSWSGGDFFLTQS